MMLLPSSDEFVSFYADGSVVFSAAGIQKYRALFGRARFDIQKIKDYDLYAQAMCAIQPYELDDLRAGFTRQGEGFAIQSKLLAAILDRDDTAVTCLAGKLSRRQTTGIKIVKNNQNQ